MSPVIINLEIGVTIRVHLNHELTLIRLVTMEQLIKNLRFREAIITLDNVYAPFEVARWFCLGEENTSTRRKVRGPINRKLYEEDSKDHRGATINDVMCTQLLKFLHDKGYDLGTMEFDDEGRLLGMKKRPPLKKSRVVSGSSENAA